MNDCLHHLEANGYLVRAPPPDDGRAWVARLRSRPGVAAAPHAAGRQVEREWEEEIGEPERSTFVEVLDRLAPAALQLGPDG